MTEGLGWSEALRRYLDQKRIASGQQSVGSAPSLTHWGVIRGLHPVDPSPPPNRLLGRGGGEMPMSDRPDLLPEPYEPSNPVEHQLSLVASLAEEDGGDPVSLLYQHTVLAQCGMPYRDPGPAVRRWERRNGRVSLEIEAGRARDPRKDAFIDVGLPYGPKPRLLLAYLNSEALKHNSPEVEVEDSLRAFIRRLGMSTDGRTFGTVKDQLTRLSAAQIRLAVDYSERGGRRTRQAQTHLIGAFDLWFPKDERQRVLWPTSIRLGLDYYVSLKEHAVPLAEPALKALAGSAFALDVYSWLAQRLYRVKRPAGVLAPWPYLQAQFGADYAALRNFRTKFIQVLRDVQDHYPGARVAVSARGVMLYPSPSPVPGRALRSVSL